MLTREQVEQALPPNLRSAATQEFTDQINNLSLDPLIAENIRENFLSFSRILLEGKFKTEDYLHAVAYVSFKHMGYSNQDAYFRTFPNRHSSLVQKGASPKDISAYVSAYHKGKLVNLIMEQSLVPIWIVNQENYQRAINTQVEIMEDMTNPAVARTQAANSILTHLSKPKDAVNTLKLEVQESQGMKDLRSMLEQLARNQRQAIEGGMTTKMIAEQKIIDITPISAVTIDAR
jgi:glutamine synthetase type III